MCEFICNCCRTYHDSKATICSKCQTKLVFQGSDKNITDTLAPDCLIHRYRGSDLLELACVVKEGKVNVKVALKLKDYAKPVVVPKSEVFCMDPSVYASISALRADRRKEMDRYDDLIAAYWSRLEPYRAQATY